MVRCGCIFIVVCVFLVWQRCANQWPRIGRGIRMCVLMAWRLAVSSATRDLCVCVCMATDGFWPHTVDNNSKIVQCNQYMSVVERECGVSIECVCVCVTPDTFDLCVELFHPYGTDDNECLALQVE